MNYKQAYEIISDYTRYIIVVGGALLLAQAKGYLESADKAQALEECIDGLLCGTCDAETAEEVLRKWRREK